MALVREWGVGGPLVEIRALSIEADEPGRAHEERLWQAAVGLQVGSGTVAGRYSYCLALREWARFVGHRDAAAYAQRLIDNQGEGGQQDNECEARSGDRR